MALTGLRYEDRLDGAENFSPWKERITVLFKEQKLWDIIGASATITVPTDAALKADFDNKDIKAQRILLDSIKDHVIPHVTGKSYAFEMWAALCTLYQSKNQNRKMVLREKLRNAKMTEIDTVSSYLTKITQIRDELGASGEKVEDEELVRHALNGFTTKWHSFVKGVVARDKLPDWTRLWDDFVQEESREGTFQGTQSSEENVALAVTGKGKKKREKDLSKIRCFLCNKMGHFASQCPNAEKKKKGKVSESDSTALAAIADFGKTFDEEFSLTSIATSVGSCTKIFDNDWLIDSGATKHMTDTQSKFISVTELDPGHFVKQGDSVRAIRGIGSVRFKLCFGKILDLNGVLFVPELRTSLISVSALEKEGFGVLFKREHVFLIPVGDIDGTILLGSQKEGLYTLKGENVYPSSGWISESGTKGETAAGPIIQFPENSGSLVSTGRRLNQYGRDEQGEGEVDSQFRVVYRSRIQIPEQEGASAEERGCDIDSYV